MEEKKKMKGKKKLSLVLTAIFAVISMLSLSVSSSALCLADLLRTAGSGSVCANGGCGSLSDILSSLLANRQNGCGSGQSGTAAQTKPADNAQEKPAKTAPAQIPANTVSSEVQQVFELVNSERRAAGLKELVFDEKLCAAASVRAGEIASYFSHTRPDGRSCFTVFAENGISYRRAGENIASGQTSAGAVMNGWMNSSGHRANILNASFERIGIACEKIGGRYQWVQLFAA